MADSAKLDRIVAEARRAADERALTYREQALKIYPWVCGRCARTFTRANLRELTVHHRDHDHANNPPDGSNWELLCEYCHDNEHQKQLELGRRHGRSEAQGRHPQSLRGPEGQAGSEEVKALAAELLARLPGKVSETP